MKNLVIVPIKDLISKKHLNISLNLFDSKELDIDFNNLEPTKKLFYEKKARLLEKKILPFLFKNLNKVHKVKYNFNDWYIILGYWLRRYCNVLTQRFYQVENILKKNNFHSVHFLNYKEELIYTEDSYSFIKATNSIYWNHFFIKKLFLLKNKKIIIKYINKNKKFFFEIKRKKKPKIKIIIDKLFSFLTKNNDSFIFLSKLSIINLIKLNLKTGQFPRLFYETDINYEKNKQSELRLKKYLIKKKNLLEISKSMIFQTLPMCYLENFHEIKDKVKTVNWPKNPKIILTDSAMDTNEIFKFWTQRQKSTNKSKYYIMQHGNNYGTSVHTLDNPEEIISDKFFTWGWKSKKKNIKKFYNYTLINFNSINQTDQLIFYIDIKPDLDLSWNTNIDWYNYLKSNKVFLSNLNNNLRSKMCIKFHPSHDQNQEKLSFNLKEVKEKKSYFSLKKTMPKLGIFGYDGTGFLERLSLNLPTIAFWNIKNSRLRKDVIQDYKRLIRCNIIFEKPQEASKFLNLNFSNLENWWYSNHVQSERLKFVKKFSNNSKNILKDISKILKK